MRLNPGDRIYLYSDGIVEVRNAERVQFGDERLIRTLPQNRGTSLGESLENLVRAATSWSDGPFDDDASGLSIEITEAGRQADGGEQQQRVPSRVQSVIIAAGLQSVRGDVLMSESILRVERSDGVTVVGFA